MKNKNWIPVEELEDKLNYLIGNKDVMRVHRCPNISSFARKIGVERDHIIYARKRGAIYLELEKAIADICRFDVDWEVWKNGKCVAFKDKYHKEVVEKRVKEYSYQNKSRQSNTLKALDDFRDAYFAPKMVVIPGGVFTMGSQEIDKQHIVTISKKFALGCFLITFKEWDCAAQDGAFAGFKVADNGWGRGHRPVIYVSWLRALAYIRWLSNKTGYTYRLPSEAEWEYACRAGSSATFSFGNEISNKQANYNMEWSNKTTRVGMFAGNEFGLHDMHGNVWEWCADAWHDAYEDAPTDGSVWDCDNGDGRMRVVRGGSWRDPADLLRSASRRARKADWGFDCVGFRVAREIAPAELDEEDDD